MNDKQVYLHIGFHKTASTYFQKKIWSKLEGIQYINWAVDFNKNYHKFVHENPVVFDKKYFQSFFDEKLNGANKVLISEEKLSGQPSYRYLNNQSILIKLNQVFPNAKYLVFIRNQFDLSLSLYKQFIKEGGWTSLEDYFGFENDDFTEDWMVLKENFNLSMLRFDKYFEYILTMIPKENLKVFQFEDLSNPDKYAEIYDFLGVKNYPPYTMDKVNLGYNSSQINLARKLNRLVYSSRNKNSIIPQFRIPKMGTVNKAMVRRFVTNKHTYKYLNKEFQVPEHFEVKMKRYYNEGNKHLEKLLDINLNEKYFI